MKLVNHSETDKPPDVVFTIKQLLDNLGNATPALRALVFAAMYLTGFLLVFIGIYKLKHYGDIRTMMSSSAELKSPLIYMFVGAGFLYFPSLVYGMMGTMFNSHTIMSYQDIPNWGGDANSMFKDLGLIIQVVGFIAFFRGWLLVVRLANQGAQPGTFGKALTHIIGGIFAINFFQTWEILEKTFGFHIK